MDRAIGNLEWTLFAPECSVRNLHCLKFDHRPVLIFLQSNSPKGDRPFRCLPSWFCHSEFRSVVTSFWDDGMPIVSKLDCFKTKISEWNKVYGNIFERK